MQPALASQLVVFACGKLSFEQAKAEEDLP